MIKNTRISDSRKLIKNVNGIGTFSQTFPKPLR